MSKNSTRGEALSILTNAYVAGPPTFFPKGYDGHTKDCLTFNVYVNEGVGENGVEYKSQYPVKIWGPWADSMAKLIKTGVSLNITGRPQSFMKPTGNVTNGKPQLWNTIAFVATRIHVISESQKDVAANLARNVARLIQSNQIPAQYQGILTAQNLLGHEAPDMSPFNAAVSTQTGKHGHANVWTKDRGMWIGTATKATSMNIPEAIPGIDMNDPNVVAILNALKQNVTATSAINGVAAPIVVQPGQEPTPVVQLEEPQVMEAGADDANLLG